MKQTKQLFIFLFIVIQSAHGQTPSKKQIYNKDFGWTISIPDNFESVSSADWAKMQNKGADAIEKTYDQQVVNHSKTIFVFKSDQMDYFESNYQPYDTAIDGNYLESCQNVNGMLYETFKAQIPDIKIDSSSTMEKIDGLEFHVFVIKLELPNGVTLNSIMYSRLFDKKEFSVNIMYLNESKGRQMLDSWRQSKFGK